MIIGHIDNFEKDGLFFEAKFLKVFTYLNDTDFIHLSDGRYELGEGIFASVQTYTTEPKNSRRPESHVEYIDVQYMAMGKEIIGCTVLNDSCKVQESLLPEKDLIFYSKVEGEFDVFLSTGMYAVFFPWDVHRPSVENSGKSLVKKVVVKIPVDVFL